MYWNPEHYPDPTAGAALRQLYRKEKDLNTGKQFEADWKKSMPPDAWCYRLKDSAASYYGGNENLSFSMVSEIKSLSMLVRTRMTGPVR